MNDNNLDELFLGTAKQKKIKPNKPEKKPMVNSSHQIEKEEEQKPETLLTGIQKVCGDNRYLEGILIGEIINSPRFKNGYYRR